MDAGMIPPNGYMDVFHLVLMGVCLVFHFFGSRDDSVGKDSFVCNDCNLLFIAVLQTFTDIRQ